jgi:acrylyl-CoA reductase (NADPH)
MADNFIPTCKANMDAFNAYLIEGTADAVTAGFKALDESHLDAGEVLVKLRYASVNYKDALAATGRGRIIRRFPCVGGIDAVGIVDASASPRFQPGDSVVVHSHGFGVSHHGGYAAWARVPADWVNLIPQGLSDLDAITIGVAGYTAALAIDIMELNGAAPKRGRVLVNGATGGVAGISIDILAQRGFEVVAVTSKPEFAGYLRELGAAEVIASGDLPPATRPLEKALWAAAIDSLGGEPLAALTRTMNKDGVIASIGNAAGLEFTTSVMPFILRGVRLLGVNSDNEPDLRERVWQRLATDLRPRHLARIRKLNGFRDLPQVLSQVATGRSAGRNVIDLGDAG